MKRAATIEEIKPLIALCKDGKLFAVQKWIAEGKPLDAPLPQPKKSNPNGPLHYAVKAGFHSLVEVLLDGGACIEDASTYPLLNLALSERKFEIAKLLADRGADIKDMDVGTLLETWNADLVAHMVERGADLETDYPIARAFCNKVQSTLRVYKQFKDRFPGFQEQANMALRYHCGQGNLKWVSLMLWLGADPYAHGPENPDDKPDEGDYNALELAAFRGHFDVLRLKKINLDYKHERANKLMHTACFGGNPELLEYLLERGFSVIDQSNGGSSHIETMISSMGWSSFSPWGDKCLVDNEKSKAQMKMVFLLVKHGAKWIPEGRIDLLYLRRGLLSLIPDYTAEFVWIMSKHKACDLDLLERLLQTPKMQGHIRTVSDAVDALIEEMREESEKKG